MIYCLNLVLSISSFLKRIKPIFLLKLFLALLFLILRLLSALHPSQREFSAQRRPSAQNPLIFKKVRKHEKMLKNHICFRIVLLKSSLRSHSLLLLSLPRSGSTTRRNSLNSSLKTSKFDISMWNGLILCVAACLSSWLHKRKYELGDSTIYAF